MFPYICTLNESVGGAAFLYRQSLVCQIGLTPLGRRQGVDLRRKEDSSGKNCACTPCLLSLGPRAATPLASNLFATVFLSDELLDLVV